MDPLDYLIAALLILAVLNLLHWRFRVGEQYAYFPTSGIPGLVNVAMLLVIPIAAALTLADKMPIELTIQVAFAQLGIVPILSIWVRLRKRRGYETEVETFSADILEQVWPTTCSPFFSSELRELLNHLSSEERVRIHDHLDQHISDSVHGVKLLSCILIVSFLIGTMYLPWRQAALVVPPVAIIGWGVLWWRGRDWRRQNLELLFETEWARQQGYTRENVRLWKLPWIG